jgi:hypothetical protein
MQRSPSPDATIAKNLETFPIFYLTRKFISVHRSHPVGPILSHFCPGHTTPIYLSKIHLNIVPHLHLGLGRVIAQAVSRWLPTAVARARAGSGHVGFVVDKVALGQVVSEYFGFPCQSSFHQLLHSHPHLSCGACTIGQKWPQYLVE